MSKANPFDYLNSINQSKEDLMDSLTEKDYPSFMVNRGLSYFIDTILHANEMNRLHHLDNRLQYDYYINSIRRKKRFSKWAKAKSSDDIEVIKEYYGYNNDRAIEVLSVLTPAQIIELKKKVFKGGKRGFTN